MENNITASAVHTHSEQSGTQTVSPSWCFYFLFLPPLWQVIFFFGASIAGILEVASMPITSGAGKGYRSGERFC